MIMFTFEQERGEEFLENLLYQVQHNMPGHKTLVVAETKTGEPQYILKIMTSNEGHLRFEITPVIKCQHCNEITPIVF